MTSADWRLQLPESRRRHVRIWFWSVAAMTFAVLVVGGITRLTHSGLSIVDWDPLFGAIPPLSDAQWQAKFEAYQQFPEYQKIRHGMGMTLAEFKFIFFWEYTHRLLARTIGIVFLIPFAWFAARGYFNRALAGRSLLLFGLGGMQGLMGWLMVASGLVDRPSVSHFRLAAHLSLAFIIFGTAVWLAREMAVKPLRATTAPAARRAMARGLAGVGVLLAMQIVWGAFVAGLKAGFFSNTFPLMAGRLVPTNLLGMDPALLNFVQNPTAVQWTHRLLGTLLALAVAGFFLRVRRLEVDAGSSKYNVALTGLMLAQYALGIATLVLAVPVPLGVTHQAMAMVIFGVWVAWVHHVRTLGEPALNPAREGVLAAAGEGR